MQQPDHLESKQPPPGYNEPSAAGYGQQPPPGQGYPPQQQGYPPQQQGYPPQQQGYPQPQGYTPVPQQQYPPPQPQMNVMNNTTVVTSAPAAPVVVVQQQVRPSDCLTCSILNLLCCNLLFGTIAVVFSCMARDAFDRGDTQAGLSHVRIAKAMNIIGPLVSVILIIVVIVYSVTAVSSATSYINDYPY